MPLYTVTMKGGHTIQVRATDKDDAKRQAISRAKHFNEATIGPGPDIPPVAKSVRVNK